MSFTPIPMDEPVVIAPVPEKVFDKQWLSHIRINSTVESGSKIIIHAIPFNGTETLPEPLEQTVIENIFDDIQNPEQPEALRALKAQVMDGVFQLYIAEMTYRKELARLETEAEISSSSSHSA
jgi:hypothetical protein